MAAQVNGHVEGIVDTIHDFFARNPKLSYDIHVTRWKRDASGYVRRYAGNASEMVRVYAFGGGGTLFEVINGAMGLPNVQVAYFPLGKEDTLFLSLGKELKESFMSMPNLIFSRAFSVDTIRAGNHYVFSGISVGIGAASFKLGRDLSNNLLLPLRAAYAIAGAYYTLTKKSVQRYRLEAKDIDVEDDFAGIYIANVPGNGGGFPATEVRFNDGYMDVYTVKLIPPRILLRVLLDCRKGMYFKWQRYISHYRCKKIKLSSATDMTITLDGEFFYDTKLNLEVLPSSLNFVCPPGIDDSFFTVPVDKPAPPDNLDLPEEIPVSDFLESEDSP
jgi:diacylglycerol kinase family enzyme